MFVKIGTGEKLSEKIFNQLEKAIRNKDIQPGEKIPTEMEMCRLFNVSRTAVREAVQKLEAKGLITIKKGSGIYVNQYEPNNATDSMQLFLELNLNSEYILHVMELRKIIEPALAEKAAIHRSKHHLKNLSRYINQLAALDDYSYKKEGELDKKFHHEIASASANPVVLLILKPVFQLMPKIRTLVYKDVKYAKKSALAFHQKIYDAIAAKKSGEAKNLMIEHLRIAEKHSQEILKNMK